MDCNEMNTHRVRWQVPVNALMNLPARQMVGFFFIMRETVRNKPVSNLITDQMTLNRRMVVNNNLEGGKGSYVLTFSCCRNCILWFLGSDTLWLGRQLQKCQVNKLPPSVG